MSESNCPICYASLETRDVAPCWDCGANPIELNHLAEGRHKYAEFLVFDTAIIGTLVFKRLECLFFPHDRLSAITVLFKSEEFDSLLQALSRQYGQWYEQPPDGITTTGGQRLTGPVLEWKGSPFGVSFQKYLVEFTGEGGGFRGTMGGLGLVSNSYVEEFGHGRLPLVK